VVSLERMRVAFKATLKTIKHCSKVQTQLDEVSF
jgi:hypothetical protein